MSTKRTTISMPSALWEITVRRAEEEHFPNASAYLQYLIREDERKQRDRAANPLSSEAPRQRAPRIKPRQGN